MSDPVSWLQIAPGWAVVTADGTAVGSVEQVEGDKQSDIFDGLAVAPANGRGLVYVPGEQVGAIHPGEVTVTFPAAEIGSLQPFQAAPPETTFRPGRPPLTARLQRWLRGGR